jgi:hypothetical protein
LTAANEHRRVASSLGLGIGISRYGIGISR